MILSPPLFSYFSLFGFRIHYYSICIFLGVLISFFAAVFFAKKINSNIDTDVLIDMMPLLILISILGARLYYVLLSLDYFIKHPAVIFMVWQGGIAIHGAIIAGIIFGFLYLKKKKLPFMPYADVVSLVLPLGQAIGRWGNFFNSEAYGKPVPVGFPIKLFVHMKYRPSEYINFDYFHPTFLYEAVLNIVIFLALIFLYKKTANKYDGLTFFSYILLYSLIRIPLEFLRVDTVCYLFNIPFPVIVSVIGIIIGIIGICSRLKQS